MRKDEKNGKINSIINLHVGCKVINIHYSDHYWPMDTVPVYYGDIKVTLLNESHYPDWLITEFMMQRVSFELFYRDEAYELSVWLS